MRVRDKGVGVREVRGEGRGDIEMLVFIVLHIRVLGAWLAEESLVLSADVYELLPFLMKLCELSASSQPADGPLCSSTLSSTVSSSDWGPADGASSKPDSLLKFLLPGLCHLTAEDRPRRVLLEANFQGIMVNYFNTLCSHQCTRYE